MKYLLFILLLSCNIFAENVGNDQIQRSSIDRNTTSSNTKQLLSSQEKYVDFHVGENDTQNKDYLDSLPNITTRSADNYSYLKGNNLSFASYSSVDLFNNYQELFYDNCYIPQGLAIDENNNLLISMYFHPNFDKYNGSNNDTCDSPCDDDCFSDIKKSIVVRYDPEHLNTVDDIGPLYSSGEYKWGKILNVYELDNDNPDIGDTSHVGGIGYLKKSFSYRTYLGFWVIKDVELIFVTGEKDNGNSRIELYELNGHNISFIKDYITEYQASTLSVSNNYLWYANYKDSLYSGGDLNKKFLIGHKINFITNLNNGGWYINLGVNAMFGAQIPNYKIRQPKFSIQGLYCDSNPETESRLKFYFTASNNTSYVYQSILVTKDKNNDGKIEDKYFYDSSYTSDISENESYFESFYTPYGNNSGSLRRLPNGVEGITVRNGELYVLNEGASDFYYKKWGGGADVDAAREILSINPLDISNSNNKIFPSGSIILNGNGVDCFGNKVVYVLAQNKKGELYYSLGMFNNCNKVFLSEPNELYPVGKQYSNANVPRVFIEDIKGIIFFNLDANNYYGNSDDFSLDNITFRYDDIFSIDGGNEYYEDKVTINKVFGDDLGENEIMILGFDFRYSAEVINGESIELYMQSYKTASKIYIDNHSSGNAYYEEVATIFNSFNDCINSYNFSLYCMNNSLDEMEVLNNNNGYPNKFSPLNYLNTPSRFIPITN